MPTMHTRHHGGAFLGRAPQARIVPIKGGLCAKRKLQARCHRWAFRPVPPKGESTFLLGQKKVKSSEGQVIANSQRRRQFFCFLAINPEFCFKGPRRPLRQRKCLPGETDTELRGGFVKTFFMVFNCDFEGKITLCPSKTFYAPPSALVWRRAYYYTFDYDFTQNTKFSNFE